MKMRRMWFLMVLFFAAGLLVVSRNATNGIDPEQMSKSRQNIQIVLLCRTPKIKAGRNIVFWVAVQNRDRKPVLLDGRMSWPGNVYFWVRFPGSSCEAGVEARRFAMPMPKKADLVTLKPRRFYGVEVMVGPTTRQWLTKEMRKLRPGKYTFQATYYNPGVKSLGVEGFEMMSDKVAVTVE